MVKSVCSKVMWVGRAAVFAVGLAVVGLALAVIAGTAEAAKAPSLKLGVQNAVRATTSMVGTLAGPILRLDNTGEGPALELQVEPGNAPMTVNPEAGTATGLRAEDAARADQAGSAANADRARSAVSADSAASAHNADRLDDKDSSDFAAADHQHPMVVRKASRTLTSEEFVPEFVKMCQPGERAIGGGGGIIDVSDRTRTVHLDPDYMGPVPDDSLANGEVQRSFPARRIGGVGVPAGDGDTPEGWGLSIRNEAPLSRTAEVWVICTSP